MIKKVISLLLLLSTILLNISFAYAAPNIICQTAVLIDVKTGTILYEKKANQKMYPASLTKIMTAILVLERGNLSDFITVDEDTPYEIAGSHIALEPGEILTVKDLIYALMLPSANDAALALAKSYGGTEDNFVKLMNNKAKEIGAINTNFVNPHGLHDPNHYTTAADLALIAKYAMENETFRKIVKTTKYEIPPTNKKNETRYFANLNKLIHNTSYNQIYVNGAYIDPTYEFATGIKTGYTPEAGNTLVASASRNGTDLIAVIMNGVSLEMYQDAHNLFNYGFKEYESSTLISKHTFVQNIEVKNGDSKEISAITESDFTTLIKKSSKSNIESEIIINDINLPIKKNEVIGRIDYKSEGKLIGSVNLITPITVNSTLTENSGGNLFFSVIKTILYIVAFGTAVVFLLKIYNDIRVKLIRKKRKSRYNS